MVQKRRRHCLLTEKAIDHLAIRFFICPLIHLVHPIILLIIKKAKPSIIAPAAHCNEKLIINIYISVLKTLKSYFHHNFVQKYRKCIDKKIVYYEKLSKLSFFP